MTKEVQFNGTTYYEYNGGISIWPNYLSWDQLTSGFERFWQEFELQIPRTIGVDAEVKLIEQRFGLKVDGFYREKMSGYKAFDVDGFIFETEEDMVEFVLRYA